jgi:hypothetical protein
MDVLRDKRTRRFRTLSITAVLLAFGTCTRVWGTLNAVGAITTTTTVRVTNSPVQWIDENVSFPALRVALREFVTKNL